MAAKGVNLEGKEVKSLDNPEEESDTSARISEVKSGSQAVIMVKPKPLRKKQLQATEHRRRKEMEEIGKQLLEQHKKPKDDKRKEELKKEDKEHKKITIKDLQTEIEEQKAQSEIQKQKLEAKQKLLEAQEKKKEKRKKKKEMKQTKKLVQQEAKKRLEEMEHRGNFERGFKEEEEELPTLDDLEPMLPLEVTWGKRDHLRNLPPRLVALRDNQINVSCHTSKDRNVQTLGGEPNKIDQVEQTECQKSDNNKTIGVLQKREENFEEKENLSWRVCETKSSPVCRQAIEHDHELTSHHLQQYRELMLVQPERHTQCQLRDKGSQTGLQKAEMLKRQQEREAKRNEEEIREILTLEKEKGRGLHSPPPNPEEDWNLPTQVPTDKGSKADSNFFSASTPCVDAGYQPLVLETVPNPWERRKLLLEELTPQSVEDEEKMLALAMEMSLQVPEQPVRDRYKTDALAGDAVAKPGQWDLSDIGYHLVHNTLDQELPTLQEGFELNTSFDDLPEGAFDESKPCPSYTDRMTAEWRPRSQPVNCDLSSALPNVSHVNEELKSTEQSLNTLVNFNYSENNDPVPQPGEAGQADTGHQSNMKNMHMTTTTSQKLNLNPGNQNPSFSDGSLGSPVMLSAKTNNSDMGCTTAHGHNMPLELPTSDQSLGGRDTSDQTSVWTLDSGPFKPVEREWSRTHESWDTNEVENITVPSEVSESKQSQAEWSARDQNEGVIQQHSHITSSNSYNPTNMDESSTAKGNTCPPASQQGDCHSNTASTDANLGASSLPTDRTDEKLSSHREVNQCHTNSQGLPATSSFKPFKINAIRKEDFSISSELTNQVQPTSGSDVMKASVGAPFVLPQGQEDWGTELMEDILVIANDRQRGKSESDTVHVPTSEALDRKSSQAKEIIVPSASETAPVQVMCPVTEEQPHDDSTSGDLVNSDLETVNQKIQGTSQLWVIDDSVEGSEDPEGTGRNCQSERSCSHTHPNTEHLPWLSSILPDDLNVYIQYLAQNAAVAMLSNPMMMPVGASVPVFPVHGHVPLHGMPSVHMVPNSHLWQHAMSLQLQQQQELLRQQMLHRQSDFRQTTERGPPVDQEIQLEKAPQNPETADMNVHPVSNPQVGAGSHWKSSLKSTPSFLQDSEIHGEGPRPSVNLKGPSLVHHDPPTGHSDSSVRHQGHFLDYQGPFVSHQGPSAGQQGSSGGHKGLFVGNQSPSLRHQGLFVSHQGPSCGHQGPFLGHQGPSLGHQGPSLGHQGPSLDHQSSPVDLQGPSEQQLANNERLHAKTTIPRNSSSSQEGTYSLRLPRSKRPPFQIKVSLPAGDRDQCTATPPSGLKGAEHLIAPQNSEYFNTAAGVRFTKVNQPEILVKDAGSVVQRPSSGVRFSSRGRGNTMRGRHNILYNGVSTATAASISQYRPQGDSTDSSQYKSSISNFSGDIPSGGQYKLQHAVNGSQHEDVDIDSRHHTSVGNINDPQYRLPRGTHRAGVPACEESWDSELIDVEVTAQSSRPSERNEQVFYPTQKVPYKGRSVLNRLACRTTENRGIRLERQVIVKEEISDSGKRSY